MNKEIKKKYYEDFVTRDAMQIGSLIKYENHLNPDKADELWQWIEKNSNSSTYSELET